MKIKGFLVLVIACGFLGGFFFMNTGQVLANKDSRPVVVKVAAAGSPSQWATQSRAMEKSTRSNIEAHAQLHRSLTDFSTQMRGNRGSSRAKMFVERIPENLLRG